MKIITAALKLILSIFNNRECMLKEIHINIKGMKNMKYEKRTCE